MENGDQLSDSSKNQEGQDNDEGYKDLPFTILVGGFVGESQTFDLEVNITITAGEDHNNNEMTQQMVTGSC